MNECEHAADRPAEPAELVDDVALAVAAVDHHRQVALVGQVEVPVEPFLLDRERGAVPVAVEPGLADRDDPRLAGQRDDPRPVAAVGLGRVVGVDPDRGEDPAACLRPAATTAALSAAVVPTATTCDHPRRPGPIEDRRRRSRGQAGVLQVGVGVDQRRGPRPSRRLMVVRPRGAAVGRPSK